MERGRRRAQSRGETNPHGATRALAQAVSADAVCESDDAAVAHDTLRIHRVRSDCDACTATGSADAHARALGAGGQLQPAAAWEEHVEGRVVDPPTARPGRTHAAQLEDRRIGKDGRAVGRATEPWHTRSVGRPRVKTHNHQPAALIERRGQQLRGQRERHRRRRRGRWCGRQRGWWRRRWRPWG